MNYVEVAREVLKARMEDYGDWGEDAERLLDLYALLVIAKGQGATMQDIHDSWSLWMNHANPDHKSLIPFSLLSPEVAEYDRPYLAAVHETAALFEAARSMALAECREDAVSGQHKHDQKSFEDEVMKNLRQLHIANLKEA